MNNIERLIEKREKLAKEIKVLQKERKKLNSAISSAKNYQKTKKSKKNVI